MYQQCTGLWNLLSPSEKRAWETLATPQHMPGYAMFMSACLKPNPGVYLPLAGGTMTGNIAMAGAQTVDGVDVSSHAANPLAHHEEAIYKSLLTTRGDTMFRGAAIPERLAKGTQNFFLRMGANDPEWVRGYEWGMDMRTWQWELAFHNWTTTLTGSGSVVAKNYGIIRLATGATANSTARGKGCRFGWINWLDQQLEWFSHLYSRIGNVATAKIWFKMMDTDVAGDPTGQCVGWRLDNTALKGIVHDGVNLTVVDLNVTVAIYGSKDLFLKFVPGDKVYWYVDGVLKGSSAAIPSTTRAAEVYVVASITNGATATNVEFEMWRQGWIALGTG